MQALAYNQAARTFTPMWQGPVDAVGPPIVSGGLVWDIASGGFSGGGTKLYGLDPATGTVRYTLTLPSPVADHFASPSAAGGRVFLATGSTATAYQISASTFPGPGGAANPILAAPTAQALSHVPLLLRKKLRMDKKGRVRVALRCTIATGRCKGTITLRAKLVTFKRVKHKRVRRLTYVTLGRAHFNRRKGSFTVTVTLGRSARALLARHHGRLALQVISRRASEQDAQARRLARRGALTPLDALAARRSGRADDQHRAGRVVGDLVRHRAEQEALRAGHALVADDDQVGLLLLGDVEDRVGRVALARVDLDLRRPPRARSRPPPRASRRRPRAG